MYAVLINDKMFAVEVIVGNAEWATGALGGVWVDSVDLVGVGWFWDGQSFIPSEPPPSPDVP